MIIIVLLAAIAVSFGITALLALFFDWAISFVGISWDPTYWQVFVALWALSVLGTLIFGKAQKS